MPHGTLHCPPEIHQEQKDPLNLDQKYDIIQIENVNPSTLKGIGYIKIKLLNSPSTTGPYKAQII